MPLSSNCMKLENMLKGLAIGAVIAANVAIKTLPIYLSEDRQSLPEQTVSNYTMNHPTEGYKIEVIGNGRTFAYRQIKE